ncbi:MAG TPA: TonB-dependent receptor, partial [Acidobacteriaceae bacterium]
RYDAVDEMRQTLGAFVVRTGQAGGATSLFMRGGNSDANLVLIDGIPAGDIGGTFDYGTLSTTGIGKMELYRGPDSAVYGTDAGASVVTIDTPHGTTLRPVLNYSGDAGNLHTWRNEATLGGTARKLDYFGGYSRFDTANALQHDQYHDGTAVVNLGYSFTGNTVLRLTARASDSATGLPAGHDFYGISNNGKEADQDLYAGLTLEHTSRSDWHNLVRYGIARKRDQQYQFGGQGTPITLFPGFQEYFGNVVTVRGANGYTATGQAAFLTGNNDTDSNRDQAYFQSDWSASPHFNALFGFRYDNERGSYNAPATAVAAVTHERTRRTNFEYNVQAQGEFFERLNYSVGMALEKNHLYGLEWTPRLGLGFTAVRPGLKWFHGTRLRANAATGVQEPSLAIEYFSLYDQLIQQGLASDIATFHIGKPTGLRSRTYDFGIDQNIHGETLVLKAGYFHNVFDHQVEGVFGSALTQYFGINDPAIFYDFFETNTLAYRAQGAEGELDYQPTHHMLFRVGYTYLQARVLQSFASDAVAARQGTPTENPNLPGIAIGAESPLVGARPFRRAPNSGFFSGQYRRSRYSLAIKGAFASRSDDSTYLDGLTPSFDNSMILPNRDLDFGYVQLGIGGSIALNRYFTVFGQMDNLFNDQHIGPIGYPGLPLTFRTGMKIRIGGD